MEKKNQFICACGMLDYADSHFPKNAHSFDYHKNKAHAGFPAWASSVSKIEF